MIAHKFFFNFGSRCWYEGGEGEKMKHNNKIMSKMIISTFLK